MLKPNERCAVLLTWIIASGCGSADRSTGPTIELDIVPPTSLAVGGTLPITVNVYPQTPVSLISETPAVATISGSNVTGVAPGIATLRATAGQVSVSATVLVFPPFSQLTVAPKHVCGLATSGELFCWGSNATGMLGPAKSEVCGLQRVDCSPAPVPSVSSPSFVQIVAGISNTCGRTAAGETYCWGGNPGHLLSPTSAICGDPSIQGGPCSRTPVRVPGAPSFTWIGAGDSHFCGLTVGGAAYCWGLDLGLGALGAPAGEICDTTPCSRVPIAVAGGFTFQAMSVGSNHTCGLTAAGQAYCWGWNYFGQLGIGRTSEFMGGEPAPVAVATALRFRTISAGDGHTCALTVAGQAYCWGRDSNGQLGDGSTTAALVPSAVSGAFTFDSITTGLEHTCALAHTGVAYCWGHNRNQGSTTDGGELGDGTFETRLTPTLLARTIRFLQLRPGRGCTMRRPS